MVSGLPNSELMNFFGIKDTRKHIRICIRCGSENIERKQNLIECKECGKVISTKS
jgi:rRNA maturation endonuclease Nob1